MHLHTCKRKQYHERSATACFRHVRQGKNDVKTGGIRKTMILAVNRRFVAKGPKIASDKSAFNYGRLTFIYG